VGRELPAVVFAPESAARQGSLYVKTGPGQSETPFLRDSILGRAQAGAGLRVGDLAEPMSRLRLVKDADELARLRKAIAITEEAQRDAMRRIEPGMYEYQTEALIEYDFRRNGAERLGFPSIVGSGPNSTLLHYDKNRRRMEAGDLVVMDIGAEYGYYTADVTRTVPVSGSFTPRQRAIYDLVLGAQQAAIKAVRPGVTIKQLDQIARDHMRHALRQGHLRPALRSWTQPLARHGRARCGPDRHAAGARDGTDNRARGIHFRGAAGRPDRGRCAGDRQRLRGAVGRGPEAAAGDRITHARGRDRSLTIPARARKVGGCCRLLRVNSRS